MIPNIIPVETEITNIEVLARICAIVREDKECLRKIPKHAKKDKK